MCHTNSPVYFGGTDWGCPYDMFCKDYKTWNSKGDSKEYKDKGECNCVHCKDYKTAEACDKADFKQIGTLIDCHAKCVNKPKTFDFQCFKGGAQYMVVSGVVAAVVSAFV